jgi:Sep-tRNA:Cys-tRNA synthetase
MTSEYLRKTKHMINLNPLQTGGLLTAAARRMLMEWGDGYSICDFCRGKLDEIRNPPIYEFVHHDLPEFIGADIVRLTNGAREGIFTIMHAVTKPGDTIVVDENAHYSTFVAAERAKLKIQKIANSGYPKYIIDIQAYEHVIKALEKQKIKVKLLIITYPDGNYGNLPDVRLLSKIAANYDIPLIINAAYAIGRMPVNVNDIGADFIVASGHKSMASAGPIGFIGMKKKWEKTLLRISQFFKNKEIEMLGCTARGPSLLTMMASFRHVRERVKHWNNQIEKAQWFSREMGKIEIRQLGEKPHMHDVMFFESEKLYEISKHHKNGAFYLYHEFKKNNIWGIKPGLTKYFKLSTFTATREELATVIDTFKSLVSSRSRLTG